MPVAEIHLRPASDVQLPRSVHHRCLHAHLADLSAVGTGIHINAAAHRPRNAMGKFQPGEAMVGCKYRGAGHGDPCHHPQAAALYQFDSAQAVLQADDQTRHTLVRRQYICSCSQNSIGNVQFPGHFQQL